MPGAASCAKLARALGPRLAHVTAAENLPLIFENGLLSAEALARRAGLDAGQIALRSERLQIGGARLNHQRPIVHGLRAARAVLDVHTPDSWARALDARIFFWPARRGQKFAASVARDVPIATLWLETNGLLQALAPHIDLSPINSGNFLQGGAKARRGDWLFVPVTAGYRAFQRNRIAHKAATRPDTVREVSCRASIPPNLLERLLVDVDHPA